MIQSIIQWLEDIGLAGLLAAMFLEGSSLPFPGIAVVLVYGYMLPFSYWNTIWIAAGMSLAYCLASLIPYFIGRKLEKVFQRFSKKGLKKSKDLFDRYGEWSVALSRPFGIGNYISYIAGVGKMGVIRYLLLTFVGIYPWSYVMILLGHYFEGSYQALQSYFQNNSIYFYLVAAAGIIFILFLIKYKRNRSNKVMLEGGEYHG